MILIAGLGNPGPQYEQTRHNIGFMIVDKLLQQQAIEGKFSSNFNAYLAKGSVKGVPTIFVKPLTFMNLSGTSLAKIVHWYKMDLSEIVVIYDDIDLPLGQVRFRPNGSAGGHNGIKSIIECFGGESEFNRLRVGIGPGPGGSLRKNFVLTNFYPEQQALLDETISRAADGITYFIQEGMEKAMNTYNASPEAKKNKKQKKKFSPIFINTDCVKIEIEEFYKIPPETLRLVKNVIQCTELEE